MYKATQVQEDPTSSNVLANRRFFGICCSIVPNTPSDYFADGMSTLSSQTLEIHIARVV